MICPHPVSSLMQNPEDVPLLQEVLSDAAVTADYSFITHQRRFNLPCKSIRSLALRWLLVAHNALESARYENTETVAAMYQLWSKTSHLTTL